MRYICVPEVPNKAPVLLEIKNNSAMLSVLNKISALEHTPSTPFNSMFCSFLKSKTNVEPFTYDYLATEAITEKVDYFEVKLNGASGALSYPLRFIQSEMQYNFLLATKQGEWDAKHSLTYSSLAQNTKTGYGLGCAFFQELPPSRVQFNLALKSVPSTQYTSYFYTIGHVQL
jgi:hypothetical protein